MGTQTTTTTTTTGDVLLPGHAARPSLLPPPRCCRRQRRRAGGEGAGGALKDSMMPADRSPRASHHNTVNQHRRWASVTCSSRPHPHPHHHLVVAAASWPSPTGAAASRGASGSGWRWRGRCTTSLRQAVALYIPPIHRSSFTHSRWAITYTYMYTAPVPRRGHLRAGRRVRGPTAGAGARCAAALDRHGHCGDGARGAAGRISRPGG